MGLGCEILEFEMEAPMLLGFRASSPDMGMFY